MASDNPALRRAARRSGLIRGALASCLAGSVSSSADCQEKTWQGVDKTVIEKVAEQSGRPAREPYLNTDRGDLLLFLFLVAGAVGGFIAGYAYRSLFPPRVSAAGRGLAIHERDDAPAS